MGLFDRIKGAIDGVREARAGGQQGSRPASTASPASGTTEPVPAEEPRHATVTVQPGQTLSGIAQERGVDLDEMVRLNGIERPDLIFPGQVFKLPRR